MRKGFTVIELLIVIVIIGILLAVGFVSYTNYQKRANDAAVRADLESISGELEAYRTRVSTANPNQRFPTSAAEITTLEIQAAKNVYDSTAAVNMVYCVGPSGTDINANQTYKLIAMSKSGNIYLMTQDGFVSHSYTSASMTTSLCSGTTPTQVNGWTSGGGWAAWVRSS